MPFSAGNSVCGLSSCGWQWIVAVSGLLSRHHPIQQQKRQLILDHHFLRKGNFLHTSQKSSPYVFHGQNYSMCPCWVDFSVWLYESKCKSVSPWDKSGCVEGVCVHTSDRWIHIQQCSLGPEQGPIPKPVLASRIPETHMYINTSCVWLLRKMWLEQIPVFKRFTLVITFGLGKY